MSGPLPPDSPPPEVPEEFADAYRAAYRRALAAQSQHEGPGQHVDPETDETGLPRRRSALRVGTHRPPPPTGTATWFERVRDSRWFVPLLLLLLALLLVVGAYTLGRAFADRVGARTQTSSTIVTGPSLTSSTSMSAPKTPVSTVVPSSSRPLMTAR